MDGTESLARHDGSQVEIGDRICFEGFFATIRYIGPVPPQEGVWLGVEWDDVSRGKHGGTYKGKEYFRTRQDKAGSFVRAGKVQVGLAFLKALEIRYGLKEDDNAGVNPEDLFVLSATRKATKVEMIGAKTINIKQSQFDVLKRVGFDKDHLVYGAGLAPHNNIGETTPCIEELDLSQSLLPSWTSLAAITSQLPKLRFLNVGYNRLLIPEDVTVCQNAFSKLQTLYMNKMEYNWDQILKICTMCPGLHELHACYNPIESFAPPTQQLGQLTFLSMEGCIISKWDEVLKLGNLTSLESLLLSENRIISVFFPDAEVGGRTTMFPKLRQLALNANKITDWKSVNELNKLPSLEELKMKDNPLFEGTSVATVRQFVIARIAGLKIYNRSEVLAKERKEAEIDYLKRYGRDWMQAGGNADPEKNHPNASFLLEHPRFQELSDKLGAPEESEMEQKSLSMKDTLITVKIQSAKPGDYAVVEKKLPPTMTIQKLKGLIRRLYKLTGGDLQLSYRSHRMQGSEIVLDNELRYLSFYSVESGDIIEASWE